MYDLRLPAGFEPRNSDAEVEKFYCWPMDKVCTVRRGNSSVCPKQQCLVYFCTKLSRQQDTAQLSVCVDLCFLVLFFICYTVFEMKSRIVLTCLLLKSYSG